MICARIRSLAGKIVSCLCLAIVAGYVSPANAGPITYAFVGTGGGTIGQTTFTNSPFVITMTGDTANAVLVDNWYSIVEPLSAVIDIAGVGHALFSMNTYLWTGPHGLGGLGEGNVIGFGGRDPINRDLVDIVGSFPLYDLESDYGPVTSRNVVLFQFRTDPYRPNPVGTTLGDLAFYQMSDVTFQAETAPVPEPTTLLLLPASGVILLFRRFRFYALGRCGGSCSVQQ